MTMQRWGITTVAALLCLALVGCGGNQASTPDEMREIAEARDACHELSGTFLQWYGATSYEWKCDFSDPEPHDSGSEAAHA